MNQDLTIKAGKKAFHMISQNGFSFNQIDTLAAASGGPKILVLKAIDEYLIKNFFHSLNRKIDIFASSVGCWRASIMASQDALNRYHSFIDGYTKENVTERLTPADFSAKMLSYLEALFEDQRSHLCQHPYIKFFLFADQSRVLKSTDSRWQQSLSMIAGFLDNLFCHGGPRHIFRRTIFQNDIDAIPPLNKDHLQWQSRLLTPENILQTILASGSIPVFMQGVHCNLENPKETYWDGGINTYHMNLPYQLQPDKLVLFPHFFQTVTPGWFDQFLSWRNLNKSYCDQMIMICPSNHWIQKLPYGRIPSRKDYTELGNEERKAFWQLVVKESTRLADAFDQFIHSPNPELWLEEF